MRVAAAIAALRDTATERALHAERALAGALGASCRTPIGAHAKPLSDGSLELRVFVGRADGSSWVRDSQRGSEPVALGETLAERLRSVGVAELLA